MYIQQLYNVILWVNLANDNLSKKYVYDVFESVKHMSCHHDSADLKIKN